MRIADVSGWRAPGATLAGSDSEEVLMATQTVQATDHELAAEVDPDIVTREH